MSSQRKKRRRKQPVYAGTSKQQIQQPAHQQNSEDDQGSVPAASISRGVDSSTSTMLFQKLSMGIDEITAQERSGPSSRNFEALLAKAEAQQQRALELKKSDAGKQLLKERQWSTAMDKVDGKRVRDDPKLIKKVMHG